jgi:hypothetical protein
MPTLVFLGKSRQGNALRKLGRAGPMEPPIRVGLEAHERVAGMGEDYATIQRQSRDRTARYRLTSNLGLHLSKADAPLTDQLPLAEGAREEGLVRRLGSEM